MSEFIKAITPLAVVLTPVFLLVITGLQTSAANRAARRDKKLDEIVKVTVDTAKVAVQTHVLVNSKMGRQLALTAQMARSLATKTGEKIDIINAETAEKELADHVAKQSIVDMLPGDASERS